MSAPTRTVLHVGCGSPNPKKLHRAFRGPEWRELRFDIDAGVAPDVVGDMRDLSAMDSGAVDALWSSHNIEHLYPHEVVPTLAGFKRVLKPDGFALVTLPDLQEVARLIVDDKLDEPAYVSPAGPIAPLDMLYGFRRALARGNLFMAHRTGFTAKTLAQALVEAGFATVAIRREPAAFNLWALAFVAKPEAAALDAMLQFLPASAGSRAGTVAIPSE